MIFIRQLRVVLGPSCLLMLFTLTSQKSAFNSIFKLLDTNIQIRNAIEWFIWVIHGVQFMWSFISRAMMHFTRPVQG